MNPNLYPLLYSSCIPVKGFTHSIICDLQNQCFIHLPNELFSIVDTLGEYTLGQYEMENEPEIYEFLKNYFLSLRDNQFLFFTESPKMFPKIAFEQWDFPALISNAIIDLGRMIEVNLDAVIADLVQLGCKHLQIRSFGETKLSELSQLLSNVGMRLKDINLELILKYSQDCEIGNLKELANLYPCITSISFHSANTDKILDLSPWIKVLYTKTRIQDETHCGKIDNGYFRASIETFAENQKWNSCLNRKIAIDRNGYIKNCPSMTSSYGLITERSILDVVLNIPEFRDLWQISKDKIEVCRDCEYRYICSDCRAYLINPTMKPARCNYDPYQGKYS